jgi:hypothetical protein
MPVHADLLAAEDTGEVQVLVIDRIDSVDAREFRMLMHDVRRWRLCTGAHPWSLDRDFDRPDQWVESFLLSSWVEYLRQHTRTTGYPSKPLTDFIEATSRHGLLN